MSDTRSWLEAKARPMEPTEVKGQSQKNNWKLQQQRPFEIFSGGKKNLKRKTIVS